MAETTMSRWWRSNTRQVLRDGVSVAGALLVGAFLVLVGDATGPVPGHLPWQVDVALGTVACLSLVLRRRRPVALAVAVVPLSAFSVMATGAVLVVIFGLALRRSSRAALIAASGYLATAPIYALLQRELVLPLWVDLVVRGGLATAAFGWGLSARARRSLIVQLGERAERAEAEQAARAEQVRRDERDRIAREMHDVMAHRLSMISLHAGALEVHPNAGTEANSAAGVIRSAAHEALEELRTVMGVLRHHEKEVPEPPQPGLHDIRQLVEDACCVGGEVSYDDRVAAASGPLPPASAGRVAFRVVQEALTNARKHAPGCPVAVLVEGVPGDGLRIVVTNRQGTAGGSVPGSGLGLVGLAERVELAGGRLAHSEGAGTFRLEARLPWLT